MKLFAHVTWPSSYRDDRGGSQAQNPGMNLHVSGLAGAVTADDLNKHFSAIGEVCDLQQASSQPRRDSPEPFGFCRLIRLRSCTTLIPRTPVDSDSL